MRSLDTNPPIRAGGAPGGTPRRQRRPHARPKPRNPYSEEGISIRRSVVRPPFPDQRKRTPRSPAAAPARGDE